MDWQRVLATHERWLKTVILARTGESQVVEDLYQDIAAAAVQQQAPLKDPEKVAAWLYQITVHHCQMYLRKQGRQKRLSRDYQNEGEHEKTAASENPLAWLLADERRQHIRLALERLPEDDIELLMLKHTEHWTYAELAEHLGITISAVESRLHRARQKLRKELTRLQVIEIRK